MAAAEIGRVALRQPRGMFAGECRGGGRVQLVTARSSVTLEMSIHPLPQVKAFLEICTGRSQRLVFKRLLCLPHLTPSCTRNWVRTISCMSMTCKTYGCGFQKRFKRS